MANNIIRPAELPPRANPIASEIVPSDNGVSVAAVTWADGVNAGRPLANQAEAEAGINATKAMTPLTTKQAIEAQGAVLFATSGQGALADTAVQPGSNRLVPAGGATGQVLAKTSGTDYATEWTAAGVGDMLEATYDPQAIGDDAFDRANHTGTQTAATINDFGPSVAALSDFFRGFAYSNNATTPATHIDVAAGMCRDSLNVHTINLVSTITKQVNALWAEGDGEGGWDFAPGAVPSGFHWIHAIYNPTTDTSDVLFSASINAPVMPTGYTHRRLIGGFAYASGDVFGFVNEGEWHYYKTRFASVSDQNITTTTSDFLLAVPLGAKLQVQTAITVYNSAGAAAAITIRDPDLGTFTASAGTSIWYHGEGDVLATQAFLRTNTTGEVRAGSSSATSQLSINVEGWRLDRSVYR